MTHRKTTSIDIAHEAGVSQATVSRALRDSPLVNPATRKRIKEIAARLNYHVDRSAVRLRSQQSRTLALLLFEDPTTDDSQINPFFLSMLGHITRAAAREDYDVLVSFQQLSGDWYREYQATNRADGIILLGYGDYLSYGEKIERLAAADANFMIWGPMLEAHPGHSVGCDNENGTYEVTRHLLSLDRRRMAFLGGTSEHSPEFHARYRGYRRALEEAGLPLEDGLQADTDSRRSSGQAAMQRLLDQGQYFDAVVAASDLIAIGALRALQAAGRSVPGDISVVGFDDIPSASYSNPPLTTVRQDTRRAGHLLVEGLIRQIRGEATQSELLPYELVVRESCGAGMRSW